MTTHGPKLKKEEKWQIVQEKAFTGWMAQTLAKRQMTVTDLRTDLEDGILIINFFELLTKSTMKDKYDRSPKTRIQKIQNCHLALIFLERETGISLQQSRYSAEDIVDAHKDLRMILGLLWTLYRKFRMNVVVSNAKTTGKSSGPEEMLLEWVKTQVASYPGVTVTNYRTSFSNGLVFAALAHTYDPDILGHTWEELTTFSPEDLLEFVMAHAEKKMGISRLLDIDEIIEGTVDDRALALYTSLFHSAITNKKQMAEVEGKIGEVTAKAELEKKSLEELIKMNYDLTAQLAQVNIQVAEEKTQREHTHEELIGLREKYMELQKAADEKDKEIATLRLNLSSMERERNDLLAKTHSIEERNTQLIQQVEATQLISDSEKAKSKKLSRELKATKEELEDVKRKLESAMEAKEDGEVKLSQQLEQTEKKARKLLEEKVEMEHQIEVFEGQVEELKTNLTTETKEKVKTESQLHEHKEQFKVNTMGLAVLRRNLDQHLEDLHRWQKYLEGSSTDVDVVNDAVNSLADEIASLPFAEQLNVLSGKLEEENVEMTKVLQERLAKTSGKKGSTTPAGGSTTTSAEKKPHSRGSGESHRHHKSKSSGGH